MDKIILLILIFFTLNSYGITGKVVDNNGQPLPFINVWSYTDNIGTTTDFEGGFNLSINEGTPLVFSAIGYNADTLLAKENLIVTLYESLYQLDVVEITSEKNIESEQILLMERKEATEIFQNVSSQQMSKKGISNLSDGLNKIVGVSSQQSDNMYVRGLSDRYNQVTLNGLPIPSPTPDKKNIDLDLLPKSLMSNMKIRKTYSTDQWGEVGGAQIDIVSKQINDTSISIDGGVSYNTLSQRWSGGFNVSAQYKSRVFESYLAFKNYHNNPYTEGNIKIVNKQGREILNYDVNSEGYRMTNSVVSINNVKHKGYKLNLVTLFTDIKETSTRETHGTHFDYTQNLFTIRTTPINQLLFLQQLNNQYINGNHKGVINSSVSYVESGERRRQQYVYLENEENYLFNRIDKLDNHTFSNFNTELRVNVKGYYQYNNEKYKGQIGVLKYYTERSFDYERYYYDVSNIKYNVDPYTNWNLDSVEVTDPASYVENTVDVTGVFTNHTITLNKVMIGGGLRWEHPIQIVKYRDQLQPIFLRKVEIENNIFLPTFFTKYNITDKHQIKINYSQTVNRPNFRELIPFEYTEFFAGTKIRGNPELENSTLHNVDINYEFYLTKKEILSIGGFYKYILNPIERINLSTASGRLISFQNSHSAQVAGVEIEFKKNIQNLEIDFNATYLYSQLLIDTAGATSVIVTNIERSLQGVSPFIINLDVLYKFNIKSIESSVGLLYNVNGEKLYAAGVLGIGDIYQTTYHTLNFINTIKYKDLSVRFMIKNLLLQDFILTQQSDNGDNEVTRYENGMTFSFNIGYNF